MNLDEINWHESIIHLPRDLMTQYLALNKPGTKFTLNFNLEILEALRSQITIKDSDQLDWINKAINIYEKASSYWNERKQKSCTIRIKTNLFISTLEKVINEWWYYDIYNHLEILLNQHTANDEEASFQYGRIVIIWNKIKETLDHNSKGSSLLLLNQFDIYERKSLVEELMYIFIYSRSLINRSSISVINHHIYYGIIYSVLKIYGLRELDDLEKYDGSTTSIHIAIPI